MQTLLLTSKLTPPAVSRYAVERTAICNQVLLAFDSKVVLVRAPAGFGKTTVLAQLYQRYSNEGIAVAWLNLDEADNDLPRFLSYLLIALKAQIHPGSTIEDLDTRLYFDTAHLTDHLAAQLGLREMPFVLFIDEFDVIREPAVLAFVKQMIPRMPGNTRLILGSRTVPEIGLGTLRAHGKILDVTPDTLRFTADEAQLFLTQRRGLILKPEQVQELLRSTEGWPTALWLASVALQRRPNADEFIAGFAGSATALAEYLVEDVMASQPPEVREFLLKTSILTQLDARLCDVVCGRPGSAELLSRLERDSLFLTLVDETQQLYRYHSLFRDFLRAQLARSGRESLPALHRAAAQWFLAQGRPIPAVDHALETGDVSFVMPLLEQHAESLLNQGRLRLLTRWLEVFPNAVTASPALRLLYIWAVSLTRGSQEALTLLEQVKPGDLGDGPAFAQYQAMQPTLLAMRDRIDESFTMGLERLALMKPQHGFAYAILAQTLAIDSMVLGQFSEARRYVDRARAAQTDSDSALQIGIAGAVNGAIDLMQGRLRQALVELRLASGVSDDDLFQSGKRNLLPGVLLAEALYEAGDGQRAESLLNLFLPLTQILGLPDQLIVAHSVLSRIFAQQGEHDRTLELLTQLELIGHRLGLPRVVATARLEKATELLRRHNSSAAREQLERAADIFDWQDMSGRSFIANDKITLSICRARWLIRSNDAASALSLIKKELALALAGERHRRALKLRILLAEALEVDGQHNQAMRMLAKALEFGSHEGFVGSYLEEGPRIQGMLQSLLQASEKDAAYSGDDPVSAHLMRLSGSQGPTAAVPASQPPGVELVTRKELQILELLGHGFSNDAMAEKLFVSESTVRTHLRSINTKLKASNRMHALAIARQMHLIP